MPELLDRVREAVTDADADGYPFVLGAAIFIVLFLALGAAARSDIVVDKGVDIGFLLGMRMLNVGLFAGTVVLTAELGRMLFDERVALLGAALVIPTQLANHAIIAWTHVPTTFFILLAFYAYLQVLDGDGRRWLVTTAFAGGMTFIIRYSDAVMLAPIVLHGLYSVGQRRDGFGLRDLAVPVLVLLVVLAPALAFHQLSFGSVATTPYQMRPHALPPNDKPDLAGEFDPVRAVTTLPSMLVRFDPDMPMLQRDIQDFDYREYKSALFQTSPFLALSIFGILFAWERKRRAMKLIVGGMAALTLTYASWIFFSGGWTTNMRYLTPLVPFLALFTAEAVTGTLSATGRVYRYGPLAVAAALLLGLTFLPAQPLAAKAVMNLVAFAAAAVTLLTFTAAYRDPTPRLRMLALISFLVSLGVGAVMVFFLDNWVLFYGAQDSILLWNSEVNLLAKAGLAATGAAFTVLAAQQVYRDVVQDTF